MKFIITFWEEIGAVLMMHQKIRTGHTEQQAYTNAKKKINRLFPGKIKIIMDRMEKIK